MKSHQVKTHTTPIDVRTSKPPYGICFVAYRGRIHLQLKSIAAAEYHVVLPRPVAKHLLAQLTEALAAETGTESAPNRHRSRPLKAAE